LDFREAQQVANEEIYGLMLNQQLKLEEGKQIEKQRISEELHDGVLGNLFGVRLSLDGLNEKSEETAVEARANYIGQLKNIESEIRQISHDLHTNLFSSEMIYIEVVEKLIEDQCALSNLKYEFEHDSEINWETTPNTVKVHLYRILQEALQNIRKHAKASKVEVSFNKKDGQIALEIKDDGVGFAMNNRKKGIGLKNIKSRVEQMKGVLFIDGSKGKGTIISAKFNI